MTVINMHGAGDRGSAGGGSSALNGVGQKIQDILNQLYNAGGSSGAFASAQAQLSGISPGLAGMLGSGAGGAAGGGRGARGRGGAGGVGAVGGPSTVNIDVRVADIGLGKMDSTLNKILEAVKTGNKQEASSRISTGVGPGARKTSETISVTSGGEAIVGRAALGNYRRQQAYENRIANASYRNMRIEANEDNRSFDRLYGPNPSRRFPTVYNRPNWTYGAAGGGGGGGRGLAPYGGGAGGGGGAPPGQDASFMEPSMPDLTMPKWVDLIPGGKYARIAGKVIKFGAKAGAAALTGAYASLSTSQLANQYQANMAGFALTGGFNQDAWNAMTGSNFSAAGGFTPGSAAGAWAQQGISMQQAAGIMQKFGIMGVSASDQANIVTAIGQGRWMPGLAGLTTAQQAMPSNWIGQYGIGRGPVGTPMAGQITANNTQMAGILANAVSQGINYGAVLNSFNTGAGNLSSVALGTPTIAGMSSVITPYYKSGMGAAQANNASQQALTGNASFMAQGISDPTHALIMSRLENRLRTPAQLRALLGKHGWAQAQQNPRALQDYFELAKSDPAGAAYALTQILGNYGGNAISPGYENRLVGLIDPSNMGLPHGQAYNDLFYGYLQNIGLATATAGMGSGISGGGTSASDLAYLTPSQSIQFGTQYYQYLKQQHPKWSTQRLAAAYNGSAGYGKKFMQGGGAMPWAYKAGSSTQNLIYNALGPNASAADKARFMQYMPMIRQDAAKYGVSASIIARTLGLESGAGSNLAAGGNVMQVTGGAITQEGNQIPAPPGLTPDNQAAITNATIIQDINLGLSGIIKPMSGAAANILTASLKIVAAAEQLRQAVPGIGRK